MPLGACGPIVDAMKRLVALLFVALLVCGPALAEDKKKKKAPAPPHSKVLITPSFIPMGGSKVLGGPSSAMGGGSKVMSGPSSLMSGGSKVLSGPSSVLGPPRSVSGGGGLAPVPGGATRVYTSSGPVGPARVFVRPRSSVPTRRQDPVNFQTPEQARRVQRDYQRNYYNKPLVQAPVFPAIVSPLLNRSR